MKVLMINVVCGIRSTGRICTDIADELEKQGHQIKIAYGREKVPDKYSKYALKIGNDLDSKLHAIRTRLFDTHGFGSERSTRKFLKWADEYNPDLLWLHNIHGYYINVELLFNWIKSRPNMTVKWTLHDCWAFTGHCTYFTEVNCEQWKTVCSSCPQLHAYPSCIGKGNVTNNFKKKEKLFTGVNNMTLITPSKWLADLTRDSFLKEYPVEVHYNKIDTTIFKPTQSDFRKKYNLENKFIILGVASIWEKRKGLNDFIKLSNLINDGKQIVLIGLNDNQLKNLPNNIIGIKRTNSTKELAQIYSAADVFVNLTYEDNYPTVNLEAQACGTRVITYDTGGCRETLYDNSSICVETGDINRIYYEINRLS